MARVRRGRRWRRGLHNDTSCGQTRVTRRGRQGGGEEDYGEVGAQGRGRHDPEQAGDADDAAGL